MLGSVTKETGCCRAGPKGLRDLDWRDHPCHQTALFESGAKCDLALIPLESQRVKVRQEVLVALVGQPARGDAVRQLTPSSMEPLTMLFE